jgi:toxin ParE1/3/4
MKRFEVLLTEAAEHDLEDIFAYILEFDSPRKAERVLDRLLEVAERLAAFPERGTQPKELRAIGIHDYRQVYFKPYRLLYRQIGDRVIVYLIADGRRDIQSLLYRRLLGG